MRFTPLHLRVLILNWEGLTINEIAAKLGKSNSFVTNVLDSPQAKDIMLQLQHKVLDSSVEVQTLLQAAAPVALSRKIELMNSANDAVANRASQEVLELAGHVPLRQIEIHRPNHFEEEFRNKTETEIRQQILKQLGIEKDETTGETALTRLLH